MRNKRRILIKLILCTLILINLTACWNARELKDLPIVVGMGIDKAPSADHVLLTAQIIKPQELKGNSQSGSSGSSNAYVNIKNSGETVFRAIREFTHETSGRLYISHNQAIIIGRDIAYDGVQKYLDFFMRASETRPTTLILISDTTASDILDVQPELTRMPAINISKISKAQALQSQSKEIMMQEFVNCLLSKTTSAIAPLIHVSENNGKKSLRIEGMVIFKEDKLVGQLNEIETRGMLWVTGDVKSGVIDIPYEDGKVSLEIKNATSKITPIIKNNQVSIQIKIKEEGTLVAQTTKKNLATLSAFENLKKRQNKAIEEEILASFKKAQELNTDYFGLGEEVHKKYKKEWKDIESDWDDIFSSIDVDIQVESNIQATGLITKPATPESMEERTE